MASLLDFTRENNFLGLFARVRIKTRFPLKCPIAYLLKSLFKWLAEVLTFCTMQKLTQGEARPFKTTLCFLKLKKSVIIFKILSDTPFCFNLSTRTLCQTLSYALDISTNTNLASSLSSKDW